MVLLNANSWGKISTFCIILVVYLGHGIFLLAELLFSKSAFGKGLKLPNWGVVLGKKWCTSIVALVMRQSYYHHTARVPNTCVFCTFGHTPYLDSSVC